MTKQQIINNEINYAIMAGETMSVEPARGNSEWVFTFGLDWDKFEAAIRGEIANCKQGWQEDAAAYRAARHAYMKAWGADRLRRRASLRSASHAEYMAGFLRHREEELASGVYAAPSVHQGEPLDAGRVALLKADIVYYTSAVANASHWAWEFVTRPETDRYYGPTDEGYALQDENCNSWADIALGEGKVVIKTAWSGFNYTFTNVGGKVGLTFNGPRRALGTQNLLPLAVQQLVGYLAKENPFHSLDGMYDAEGAWFDAAYIVGFYADNGWSLKDNFGGYDGWWQAEKADE